MKSHCVALQGGEIGGRIFDGHVHEPLRVVVRHRMLEARSEIDTYSSGVSTVVSSIVRSQQQLVARVEIWLAEHRLTALLFTALLHDAAQQVRSN